MSGSPRPSSGRSESSDGRVSLAEEEGELKLEVSDNGVGLSESARRVGAMGLLGMKERAAGLGGVLVIHAAEGAGTTVSLSARLDETRVSMPSRP